MVEYHDVLIQQGFCDKVKIPDVFQSGYVYLVYISFNSNETTYYVYVCD